MEPTCTVGRGNGADSLPAMIQRHKMYTVDYSRFSLKPRSHNITRRPFYNSIERELECCFVNLWCADYQNAQQEEQNKAQHRKRPLALSS